jgi:hypothetical protein
MPVKPLNASAIGLFEVSKIKGFELLASVTSTLYKIIKIYSEYRKVLRFSLSSLACLHRFNDLINFRRPSARYKQCCLATRLHKVNHALT